MYAFHFRPSSRRVEPAASTPFPVSATKERPAAAAPIRRTCATGFPRSAIGRDRIGLSHGGGLIPTYVASHGSYRDGREEAFVPEGCTISFAADFDMEMAGPIGQSLLANGDIKPAHSYTHPKILPNYRFTKLEDVFIAWLLAQESSAQAGKLSVVGDDMDSGIKLCSDPAKCNKQEHPRRHLPECTGLFNRVTGNEIVILSCRNRIVSDSVTGELKYAAEGVDIKMEGSPGYLANLTRKSREIKDLIDSDPVEGVSYWETLSAATQADLLSANKGLLAAVEKCYVSGITSDAMAVTEAKNYLAVYGAKAFRGWVGEMELRGRRRQLILDDIALREAFFLDASQIE
ncbi:putative adhesin [Streptomyces kronopolitis]|uniref:putative adhesin n=1 Tax=Streptomyces kronopolitis TaxID=1612435 RepID=UPI0036B8D6D8